MRPETGHPVTGFRAPFEGRARDREVAASWPGRVPSSRVGRRGGERGPRVTVQGDGAIHLLTVEVQELDVPDA